MTIGDSSLLEGAGGFSITLVFWWHISFPVEVVQHTLLFKISNNDGMLVLINVLEFVTVIINYCAALHVVRTSPIVIGRLDMYHTKVLLVPYNGTFGASDQGQTLDV